VANVNPPVTVIVPTYDRVELLREAIDSALAQTFGELVVLVGDNGGNEATEDVVRGYADPRVRYLRHLRNLGPTGNWLELVRRADTPLVASLHDDDTWEPTFLEKTVPPLLEDPEVSLVFTDFWSTDGDGERRVEYSEQLSRVTHRDELPAGRFSGTAEQTLRLVAVWNAVQPAYAGVLRRRAVVDTEFDDEVGSIYDLWLTYRLASRGEAMYYVPERLTNYRVWEGSLTAAGPARAEDHVFSRIVDECAELHPAVDEVAARWAGLRYGRAGRLMASKDGRDASRAELRAAAPHLHGVHRAVATVAGGSAIGWDAVRLARATSRRLPTAALARVRRANDPNA